MIVVSYDQGDFRMCRRRRCHNERCGRCGSGGHDETPAVNQNDEKTCFFNVEPRNVHI